MDLLKRILNKILPEDPNNTAGYGPFRLPERCSWMERAALLHDYDFSHSMDNDKRLSEADFDLFYRWVLEAHAETDPMKRCRMAGDICRYWPYARTFGRYLWDSK